MARYRYLIVGGGMTAAAAVEGIREVDTTGSIGALSAESVPPYNRPPLSKALWKGDPEDSVWRELPKAADVMLNRQVTSIDPASRTVIDNTGAQNEYEHLLLATGSTPKRSKDWPDSIIYFRTFGDYRRLRELTAKAERYAVIGGGFIGSEIAAALAMNGKQVTMIFPEKAIGQRIFPAGLAASVNEYFREKGVTVLSGTSIESIEVRGNEQVISIKGGDGPKITVDAIVAGLGVAPNIDLAKAAGLQVDDGVIVDEALRTSAPDVFAAGDVASFENPALGRLRFEHEDNANTMGSLAGQSMAGKQVRYDHIPLFYSDLFDLGYEAVGDTDSRLETVEDWKDPNQEGVVYYLKDGKVRGVLLWNVWDQADNARAIINEQGSHTADSLKGTLPKE